MKTRILIGIWAWCCMFAVASIAQSAHEDPMHHAPSSPPNSRIDDLYRLLELADRHPMVQMQEANVEAARRRISMNSSLMNPMLMLGVQNVPTNSFSFTQDFMTSKMVGVSQRFPFPGKLRAEKEIASEDTTRTQWDLKEQRNMLQRDIKTAYFDLYHLDRAIETNRHHILALDLLIKTSEELMTTGKASQQSVLSLELERSDTRNLIIQEETALSMRKAELEAASNIPQTDLKLALTLGLPEFPYSLRQLDSMAGMNKPVLRSLLTEIEQSALQYRRNDLDKYPDFEVSLQYMQRQALAPDAMTTTYTKQSDMISATLSFDLPINYNNKRTDQLAETEAMRTMKEAQVREEELAIHTQLEMNLAQLQGFRSQYALLRDEVYPTASASMETANTNYEFGKASLEEVVRTQLNVLHREHDKYQLEADYNKTLATIEFLTGTSLVIYTSHSNWK